MGQKYIWQLSCWPDLVWDDRSLITVLGKARQAQGLIMARADEIGLKGYSDLVVEEVFATSAIEGELLDRQTIRSSVARRLGLPTAGLPIQTRSVDGVVEVLLDATNSFSTPLTAKRLHGWHAALFPTGYSGIERIDVARWRRGNEPMRVISGSVGKEKIHYIAPPASQVSAEMKQFLSWMKQPSDNLDGLIRAGIVHFWFVTIHPYDDGNGRLGRAITDMAIAQDERSGRRLYSLSAQIKKDRNSYYDILESSQKKTNDITEWLDWFLRMYVRAISRSKDIIEKTFIVSDFWKCHSKQNFNDRQIKVLDKLLDAEPEGFEGGLSNRKYVSITKTSRESAKRDLSDLTQRGILTKNANTGRSVTYKLNLNFDLFE